MSFEESLDRLASAITKSRNKKLKVAFTLYLQNFNESMRNYISFLQFLNAFQLPAASQKEEGLHIYERSSR